jgi:hypothetical protein
MMHGSGQFLRVAEPPPVWRPLAGMFTSLGQTNLGGALPCNNELSEELMSESGSRRLLTTMVDLCNHAEDCTE